MQPTTPERIQTYLDQFNNTNTARRLFSELHYTIARDPIIIRDGLADLLTNDPEIIAAHGQFVVIHAQFDSDRLRLTDERHLITHLLNNGYPYALFLFSNAANDLWHLVNVKYDRDERKRRLFRRITIVPGEPNRTATERLSLLDLATIQRDLSSIAPLAIQHRHDEAFDVEKVTEQFFKGYKAVFEDFEAYLVTKTKDRTWSHDFALQFMNRIMFLFYVQRKRWLGADPDFVNTLWRAYSDSDQDKDTFVENWLNVLFFEAFNNRFQAGRADRGYMPIEIRNTLALAPWLNGGLFTRNELDEKHLVLIDDSNIMRVLNFLNGYNFTISEDTPLDQEVAVDPEMIGKVYESLVNVSETHDERGEAGIFYTPRVEIDLMCRLAIVDWLSNNLGAERTTAIYNMVFAFDEADRLRSDEELSNYDLWPVLAELLDNVTVVDPACGSGSFLVGMLHVVDELIRRSDSQIGRQRTPYERKKRIIRNSLYGVDVMDWAIHVAELRLWLQLVIDTELDAAELKFRPLLPHLSFKLRPGDALVQEVGGVNLAHRHGSGVLSSQIKGRITRLKAEKRKFYNNEEPREYLDAESLQHEESQLFHSILHTRKKTLDSKKAELTDNLQPQRTLLGSSGSTLSKAKLRRLKDELNQVNTEIAEIKRALDALRKTKNVPFVWDISFVEVFESQSSGFDIVIGNPPYIRQELIRNPLQNSEHVTAKDKRVYKTKLAQTVYRAWPKAFNYKHGHNKASRPLSAKSDLYIYFYLVGLAILSERGSFCFVTSNSWLDVNYGVRMQEFLIRNGQTKLVIDNERRRSFANADVNTVIILLGSALDLPVSQRYLPSDYTRFVMFTVPFDQALSAPLWKDINTSTGRQTSESFRVVVLSRDELLDAGGGAQFSGDKWGKYLRAPEAYWLLMEKFRDKLVRISEVAEVRRGFTTGANSFFFVKDDIADEWQMEERYLHPAIKNSREIDRVWIDNPETPYYLLLCHDEREDLRGTNVLRYIEWGEEMGYHNRPTCRSRARWWDLGKRSGSRVNCNYLVNEVMRFFGGPDPIYVGDNFQEIHSTGSATKLMAACNSTIAQLFINVLGRTNFGEGLLKIQTYEIRDLLIPDPKLLPTDITKPLQASRDLGWSDPSRSEIDRLVFNALNFTEGERQMIEEAVAELVAIRLNKAATFKTSANIETISTMEW